jgi:uncharacterized protein
MSDFFSWQDDVLILRIHLQPRASKNRVVGIHADKLKIAITAAPIDNRANEFLIDFLADFFAVKKSAIAIVKGQTSRDKVVCIRASSNKDDIIKKIDVVAGFNPR